VSKLLSALALALAFSQGVGFFSYLGELACVTQCDDDESDTSCMPECPQCACCNAARFVFARAAGTPLRPPLDETVTVADAKAPASPEPREILHVPKRVLV
jgi:hypothetical protein